MIQSQNGEIISGNTSLLDWQLAHDPEQHVVLLKTSGPIDKMSFPAMLAAAAGVAERHECGRILADHRNSVLKLDPLEIYYAPRILASSGVRADFTVALVFSQMNEDLHFMENVCRNSGLNFAVLTEINDAFRWLKDPAKPPASTPQTGKAP